jgi:hypothetical protein
VSTVSQLGGRCKRNDTDSEGHLIFRPAAVQSQIRERRLYACLMYHSLPIASALCTLRATDCFHDYKTTIHTYCHSPPLPCMRQCYPPVLCPPWPIPSLADPAVGRPLLTRQWAVPR